MNREEFLAAVVKAVVSHETTQKLNTVYKTTIPDGVARLFSVCPSGCFLEGGRFLRLMSVEEIINAPSELHVDFSSHGVIPIFDAGDNNFIVYDYSNNCWKKFNIVDETSYGTKNNLQDIL